MNDTDVELWMNLLQRDETMQRNLREIDRATRARWAQVRDVVFTDRSAPLNVVSKSAKETIRDAGLNVAWFDEVVDVPSTVDVPTPWKGMPGTWGAVERSEVPAFKSSVADYGVRTKPRAAAPSVDVAAQRCYFDD